MREIFLLEICKNLKYLKKWYFELKISEILVENFLQTTTIDFSSFSDFKPSHASLSLTHTHCSFKKIQLYPLVRDREREREKWRESWKRRQKKFSLTKKKRKPKALKGRKSCRKRRLAKIFSSNKFGKFSLFSSSPSLSNLSLTPSPCVSISVTLNTFVPQAF